MAKQQSAGADKTRPTVSLREAVDESVLIRSAETLGRMIGSLQRQLDDATRRLSQSIDASQGVSVSGNGNGSQRREDVAHAKSRSRVRAAGNGRTASGATKTQSVADRTPKRASKSARAKKSAGENGSRKTATSRSRR